MPTGFWILQVSNWILVVCGFCYWILLLDSSLVKLDSAELTGFREVQLDSCSHKWILLNYYTNTKIAQMEVFWRIFKGCSLYKFPQN